jgi:hypothetical protein
MRTLQVGKNGIINNNITYVPFFSLEDRYLPTYLYVCIISKISYYEIRFQQNLFEKEHGDGQNLWLPVTATVPSLETSRQLMGEE